MFSSTTLSLATTDKITSSDITINLCLLCGEYVLVTFPQWGEAFSIYVTTFTRHSSSHTGHVSQAHRIYFLDFTLAEIF